jgi:hypothetical protein
MSSPNPIASEIEAELKRTLIEVGLMIAFYRGKIDRETTEAYLERISAEVKELYFQFVTKDHLTMIAKIAFEILKKKKIAHSLSYEKIKERLKTLAIEYAQGLWQE